MSFRERPGNLHGLTVLRFAHALESGGGVEQHLADLNEILSKRNRIFTIQMRLTLNPEAAGEHDYPLFQGRMLEVPFYVPANPTVAVRSRGCLRGFVYRSIYAILDRVLCTVELNDLLVRRFLSRRRIPHRAGEPENVSMRAEELCQRHNVDLLVLHTAGGADSAELIAWAKKRGIPTILVYHFANHRLNSLSLRQEVCGLNRVAGASSVNIPRYLRSTYANLSDCVDTDFYSPRNVHADALQSEIPILYTPARVTPAKGQEHVIRLAALLKNRGLRTKLVFAGRIDSPSYVDYLREMATRDGLAEDLTFTGQLSLEEYRDWYGKSWLTLLLTDHHEGMPRVIIDSQAMEVPPIAYDMGGTSEGIRNRETGFIVKPGDIMGALAAVEELLRNRDLRFRMGKAGREFVTRQFSREAFADRHERLYLDVLDQASRRSRKAEPTFYNQPWISPLPPDPSPQLGSARVNDAGRTERS